MRAIFKLTAILFIGALAYLPSGWAGEIVMTSGERFTTDHIWSEGDKIRFSMQGLVVSVLKEDVASVVRGDGEPLPLATPAPPPAQTPPAPTPPAPTPPAPKPQPRVAPEASSPAPTRSPRLPWSMDEGARPQASPSPSLPPRRVVQGTGLAQATWGMPPGELQGLKKIKTDPLYGGIDQYWLPDQRLQFGEALLDGWLYNFWQDRLYSIIMWADGRIGYERLKGEIFAHYGQGVRRRPEVERFVWDDGLSQRMLEFDAKSQSGIFVMRSSEVDQQIKARYPTAAPVTASH
ncbi:MAG: hypothetical protein HY911_01675 [Desulfobacterales bacterium]|nr:hypothetical protein [Desulfobacterales bacterium]